MLRIQTIVLALMAVFAMSVVAASSASAAEHLWLINGKLVASPVKIHAQGLLLLTDHTPLGGTNSTIIHCHGFGSGTVGPHGLGLAETVTAELLGTNNKITCSFDKQGPCESGTPPVAEVVSLPVRTELYLEGTEVRGMGISLGTGAAKFTCKAPLIGMITDECTVSLGSAALANVAGGVEAKTDAKSGTADCKIGAEAARKGAGLVRGSGLLESPSSTEKLTFNP
jgi:hypothetical protein